MISYLKGSLEVKNIDYVIIDVGGIGYKVYMSSNSINRLRRSRNWNKNSYIYES